MKRFTTSLSTGRAAMIVAIAFITSVLIVTFIDDFLLANFVVPGDTEALASDIEASRKLLYYAIFGYILVLVLDTIIGLALFVVLKPANKYLAGLTAVLRVLYAVILMIGLIGLAIESIDVYGYASIKLLGYIFFALHIFILGYAVFKSGYIPKILGILLIVASLTYIVFFIEFQLPESIGVMIMLLMAIAELSLSIWLIVKRNTLPE